MDPDLELIVLAKPATGLVARLTCFFSSIFRGTTKKQLPRPSSHSYRVTTYPSLWIGAPALYTMYVQMIQHRVEVREKSWVYTHHYFAFSKAHAKDAGV